MKVEEQVERDTEKRCEAPPRRARWRFLLFRVGAVLVGLAISLAILELAARIFLFRYGGYIDRFHERVAKEYGGELTLRDIVRASANRQKCYELIPGAWGIFAGQPLRINSAGFRDREHTLRKPEGTLRVAIIGDSVAFGWGVREEERFSNLLEAFLNCETTAPTPRVECLNFAVPGYNSVMEEALLHDAVWDYEPDVVVVNLVTNDDEVPNFVRLEPRVWDLGRCFLIEVVRDQLVGRPLGDTARLLIGGIAEAGGRGHAQRVFGYRPELVPPEYRFLVGWDNMTQALRRMCQACRQRRVQAYCLLHYDIRTLDAALHSAPSGEKFMQPWRQAALQAGFDLVDPLPDLVSYAKKEGVELEALMVNSRDIHPSPLAHRLIAQTLAKRLHEWLLRATGNAEHNLASLFDCSTTHVATSARQGAAEN